jgi:tartrate-resistant acid phosphatase type 5
MCEDAVCQQGKSAFTTLVHYLQMSGTSQHRYSVCEHGNSQTLIDHLQPLLQQYGAHYLSGHDHCMEALSDRGVSYFVSGMGDTCCYEASETDGVPEGALLWHTSRGNKGKGTIGGFTSISATAESAKVAFYDQDGNTLYTAPELLPRKLPLA